MDSSAAADTYSAFTLISDKEDTKDFIKEQIVKPMTESSLFDTQDFNFQQSKYVKYIYEENEKAARKDGVLWNILTGGRANKKFEKQISFLRSAMTEPYLWTRLWIDSRYNLNITQKVLDDTAEREHIHRADGKPHTEESLALLHWWAVRESYKWEHVNWETGKISPTSTGLVFLVDKETGKEAPLLPGKEPYAPPSK